MQSYFIGVIFQARGFLGSLITNPSSKFRNSEWRIQNGGRKCGVTLLGWYLVFGGFWGQWLRIWAQNSEIRNGGSNMANKNSKLLHWDDIWYSGVFGVADYESKLQIKKFKMAGPIWRIKMRSYFIGILFETRGFLGSPFTNPMLKFRNSKWRTKMQKVTSLGCYLVLRTFWICSLRIRAQNS